jgi:hypothetical protein
MRTIPMKLCGLNLAIPYAVQSGFRYPAFAFSAWPSLPTSWSKLFEQCSGRSGQRGIPHLGSIP